MHSLATDTARLTKGNIKLLGGVTAAVLIVGVVLNDLYTNAVVFEPIDVSPNLASAVTATAVTEQFYTELRNLRRHTMTSFAADQPLVSPSSMGEIKVKAGPFDTDETI